MTEQHGRGVQAWAQLANAALAMLPRAKAKMLFGELDMADVAAMMSAASAAGVATDGDGGGNLLYEVAAERIASLMQSNQRLHRLDEERLVTALRRKGAR